MFTLRSPSTFQPSSLEKEETMTQMMISEHSYINGTTQCTFRIISVSREVGQSFGSGALHVKIVRQLRPLDVNVWHMQLPST
jgi:hypothetical protein